MPTFIEQTQNDAFIQKLSEEVAKIGKQKASASEKEEIEYQEKS